jgi:monofunctional glycosyltransferase
MRASLRKGLWWCWRAAKYFFIGSVVLVLVLRWLPIPASAFMAQRQIAAWWHREAQFELHYTWVPQAQISPSVLLAAVAAEDQKFNDHWGFDVAALKHAWQHNARHRKVRGASTISQQVAKNLFLWPSRSYLRKGIEAYFTVLIELLWPKRRILEVYVNVAEYGNGVYGVGAAASQYFRKTPDQLSAREAALLAAVLPSPRRYSVAKPSGYVSTRAYWIQRQMTRLGGVAALPK